MKLSRKEREKLAGELKRQLAKAGLSQAQLSELAKVDPGQTSKILDGQFITLGGGVLRICKELGVDPQKTPQTRSTARQVRNSAAWAQLEASVRRAWDQTPQGARRLVAVIDAVAEVGRRSPKDPANLGETPMKSDAA